MCSPTCACLLAGPDQLDILAQAAFDEQQQQLLLQQQQQQYADPQWAAAAAAAYGGMPMASWGQQGLMSGAYWPQCMQQQYTQRHSSLSKIEHAGEGPLQVNACQLQSQHGNHLNTTRHVVVWPQPWHVAWWLFNDVACLCPLSAPVGQHDSRYCCSL